MGGIPVPGYAFTYADYNRTIVGYHGTKAEIADRLVAGEAFEHSRNEDEWLGDGIYFWEYAPKQAWWWAKKLKRFEEPAVVGAMIRLGNCFDLLDPMNLRVLRAAYARLKEDLDRKGIPLPANRRQYRDLDCAVFNYFYNEAREAGTAIDSARGVYVPTDGAQRIWRGSWIYDQAHIQICVRNAHNVVAVWHAHPDGRYGKEKKKEA